MILTPREVVPYLLRRRLVSERAVVSGDLVVVDTSRRNRNIQVMRASGPSYLLKQGLGQDGLATVAHEAVVYHRFQSDARYADFRPYLAHSYGYDRRQFVLVLELLRGARTLGERYARSGRFSTRTAAALGVALGTLHRATVVPSGSDETVQSMHDRPPWILSIHRPGLGMLQTASHSHMRLIQIVQQFPALCELLDGLRDDWRPTSLVHNDLKWDNLLVCPRPHSTRAADLKIVDWELAGIGDPCWDAGAIFGAYLGFWLLSIPITGEEPPDRFMDLARYPLEAMQPAIRAFWHAYVRRMSLDGPAADDWLQRAIRCAAARLIQTAYEHLQAELRVSGSIVILLQLSLNILQRPREAAAHLLGTPLRQASPV